MNKYTFKPNDDKTACDIYLTRFDKWIGRVELAPGGRTLQTYADDVMWLPVLSALSALGANTEAEEKKTLQELGY